MKDKTLSLSVKQQPSRSQSSPSCAFAFQTHHFYQYLQTKNPHYLGIIDPKIFHKLCSSHWVSSALLIHSNEVMLLVAIHLLITKHRRQFFPFYDLTSRDHKKYRLTRRKPTQCSHYPQMLSSFFLCYIIPHQ